MAMINLENTSKLDPDYSQSGLLMATLTTTITLTVLNLQIEIKVFSFVTALPGVLVPHLVNLFSPRKSICIIIFYEHRVKSLLQMLSKC